MCSNNCNNINDNDDNNSINDNDNYNKYNCSGPLPFKSQTYRVRYQSNQELIHHYQHEKNQLNT